MLGLIIESITTLGEDGSVENKFSCKDTPDYVDKLLESEIGFGDKESFELEGDPFTVLSKDGWELKGISNTTLCQNNKMMVINYYYYQKVK